MTQQDIHSLPDEVVLHEMIPKMSLKSLMNLRSTDHRMRKLVNDFLLEHQKSEWKTEEQIYSITRWKEAMWINSYPHESLCVCHLERWFPFSTVVELKDMYYIGYSHTEKTWILIENNPHHAYRKIKITNLPQYFASFLIGVDSENWHHFELNYYIDGYLLGTYNFADESQPDTIDSHLSEEFDAQAELVETWLEKMMTRESVLKVIQ